MKSPLVSIIMPTYNSESTIEIALNSIKNQSCFELIEILVIDGNSSDRTIEIAKKYNARILINEKRLPEFAKLIGLKEAKGRYIIRQDSDEELTDNNQIQKRIDYFRKNDEIKAMVCNKFYGVRNRGISATYSSIYGDPFSAFVYQTKECLTKSFEKNVVKKELGDIVLKFDSNDNVPIGDSGTTMFDLFWIKENIDNWDTIEVSNTLFYRVCNKTHCCGIIEEDKVIHHASGNISNYMKKLKFRVINNLFNSSESGFTNREALGNNHLKYRKFLFVLYSLTVFLPILTSIKYTIRHKDITMMLHFIYLYYICFQLAYYIYIKMLGKKPEITSYGG